MAISGTPCLVAIDLSDDAAQRTLPCFIGDAAVVLKVHADVIHHLYGEGEYLDQIDLGAVLWIRIQLLKFFRIRLKNISLQLKQVRICFNIFFILVHS